MAQSDSSAQGTVALITFITSLPPTVNPFTATSQWLTETQSAAAAKDPVWAQLVMRFILAMYGLLLVLTSVLVYIRVSNGHFSIGSVTRYGLWRPNAPNCMAILMGLFAALTIASLTLQLMVADGHDHYAKILALYGIKFITLYLAAWVFCWACACQCALATFERPWYESVHIPKSSLTNLRIVDVVRWTINIVVPGVAIASTSVIIWSFVMGQKIYQELQTTVELVHKSLDSASLNFNPKTYKPMDLIEALKPAQPLPQILKNLNDRYRLSGKIWLTFLLIFLAIYTPLLLATPRAMRRHGAAHLRQNTSIAASSAEVKQKKVFSLRRPMGNTNIEYAILLMMGWFVELAALSYVPMIAWQLSFKSLDYLRSEAFVIVATIGAHGFVSITSSAVMIMAITQTRRLLTRSTGASGSQISSGLRSFQYPVKPLNQLFTKGLNVPEFHRSLLITIPEPVARTTNSSPSHVFSFRYTPTNEVTNVSQEA